MHLSSDIQSWWFIVHIDLIRPTVEGDYCTEMGHATATFDGEQGSSNYTLAKNQLIKIVRPALVMTCRTDQPLHESCSSCDMQVKSMHLHCSPEKFNCSNQSRSRVSFGSWLKDSSAQGLPYMWNRKMSNSRTSNQPIAVIVPRKQHLRICITITCCTSLIPTIGPSRHSWCSSRR
jgi:hypothetical protein